MRSCTLLCLVLAAGCVDPAADGDAIDASFTADGKADTAGIAEGSPTALAVLSIANTRTEDQLHDDVGLSVHTAHSIANHGDELQTLADLDALPYVGAIAFHKLVAYAKATGLVTDTATTHVPTGKLLDCNTSAGPDQQVTVIGDGTKLTLRELTSSGSRVDRTLSMSEWTSEKLALRDDFGATATLTKDRGDWVMHSGGGGFSETAIADCWVDKSK
jgi:hypothetical protein